MEWIRVVTGKKYEQRPDAWLLNYTNPMTTLCRAVARETRIKTIGLCHELMGVKRHLAQLFKTTQEKITARVGGINHLTWIMDLKINGRNSLPDFAEMADHILAGEVLVNAENTSVFADHFKAKPKVMSASIRGY